MDNKSYSEQMEEQLEPRPESKPPKYKPINIQRTYSFLHRSEFFPVPSVHEEWVRNRIPRGAHYDPADDGPEIAIIAREMRARVNDFFDPDSWLSPKSWPADGPVDTLKHRRE